MSTEVFDEKALIRHVEKICASPELRTKRVLCRFLSYIISETLAGRGENIKGFSIGVDVFNRNEDFDADQDTLVRINAGRLRRMLDQYYNGTGKHDELRIEIPKGGYVPRIISRPSVMLLEPSIAVFSFNNLSGDPRNEYFARGFSYELLVELTNFEDLQVYDFLNISEHPEEGSRIHSALLERGIRFSLCGAVHGDEKRINVLVNLHDLDSGKQIWSGKYSDQIRAKSLIEIQERIAKEISELLGSEYGIILRQLTREAQRHKPQKLGTYTAVLKYYNYLVRTTPETADEAFEALNSAVKNDPESGIAISCLATLHGNLYALDFPNAKQSFALMGELSEKAYSLDPYNLFVQLAIIYKCFLCNEKERFFQCAEQMLERKTISTLRLGALGFHLSLYGDWERGKQILDSVMHGNLDFPRYFYGATTLYYYRNKSYKMALKEAQMYQVPGFFWGPLLRAAVLGQLYGKKEAEAEVRHLRRIKPDFEKNARKLISRFVKEEALVEQLTGGLQKAGLRFPAKSLN